MGMLQTYRIFLSYRPSARTHQIYPYPAFLSGLISIDGWPGLGGPYGPFFDRIVALSIFLGQQGGPLRLLRAPTASKARLLVPAGS